ncbi:MAG: hypothetical protein HETSPECPRED_003633, partial [Heterodermia speciosa]
MHVDKSVNLFEDITFEVKEQFRFFNDEQKIKIQYLKRIPDKHAFIKGPPNDSGKTTLIKYTVNAIVQMNQAQKSFRQILTCCASNDAVNNIEFYNFFVAQPIPTPPHFHRWAKRIVLNEHIVKKFPPLRLNTSLKSIFRLREPHWSTNPPSYNSVVRAAHIPPPIRYYDERHYEVFAMEALMRDVQYEQRTQSTFNGEYDFSLKPIKDRRYGSDKSYLIRLNVRDSSEARGRRLLPPEPGTAMTVRVILGLKESIPQDFVGKMIPSSSAEHENHV